MSSSSIQTSNITDLKLAPEGHLKIDWVQAHMPVLNRVREQFEKEQPFKGLKVAISLHLEAKTAYLAKVIQAGGAEVTITGSNPLSTQDDVCAALVEDGITVFAKYNPDPKEYKQRSHFNTGDQTGSDHRRWRGSRYDPALRTYRSA